MSQNIYLAGQLRGHSGWVTQIGIVPNSPDLLLTSSRDRSLLLWRLEKNENEYGKSFLKLTGHNHFVSDIVLSSDGSYAISGSWDKTLRLWDLYTGKTIRRFVDHTKDVMSVAFSSDNRLIVSGSRDKTIKLWNTLGQCKFTIDDECHKDWVSCTRLSPDPDTSRLVSCGWDMKIKVWNLKNCKEEVEHLGHTGYLNTLALSPDGTLIASGGKDSVAMIWNTDTADFSFSFLNKGIINAICFSPVRYWIALAIDSSIKIWDLETKAAVTQLNLEQVGYSKKLPECLSLCWSIDGQTLFAGYTDNVIRIWEIRETYLSNYF